MELLTREEIMEWLKIKKNKLYDLEDKGLPYIWVGKAKRYLKNEVMEWLRKQDQ